MLGTIKRYTFDQSTKTFPTFAMSVTQILVLLLTSFNGALLDFTPGKGCGVHTELKTGRGWMHPNSECQYVMPDTRVLKEVVCQSIGKFWG